MDFLYWLQQLRNPVLDFIFENISLLVNQGLLIAIVCYTYWCYDKKIAQKVFLSFCASGIVIQSLKIFCRIPRPWIIDSRIQPKPEMMETATGYSFPSGHTQTATSACYSMLDVFKNKIITIILLIFPILMMLSRMYVGVHSPLDVTVSFVISALIVYGIHKILKKEYESNLYKLCFILCIASIVSFLYAFYVTTTQGNYELIADCVKNAGAALGFGLGAILESKTINFAIIKRTTKNTILLLVIGLVGALVFKSGLKLVLPNGIIFDFIRYFLTIFWIMYLYPLLFSKKKNTK